MRLLGEIKHLLEEGHGEIPVVHPSRTSAKYEHLTPERYLFQWGATASGRYGAMGPEAVHFAWAGSLHSSRQAHPRFRPCFETRDGYSCSSGPSRSHCTVLSPSSFESVDWAFAIDIRNLLVLLSDD